jgi:branched-subunit amino acid transport protein
MSITLIVALAILTYSSRASALVFMPDPPLVIRRMLDRAPAPLFAGLAALSLVQESGALAPIPILVAAAGALCTVRFRSLPLALVGGLLGFALGSIVR